MTRILCKHWKFELKRVLYYIVGWNWRNFAVIPSKTNEVQNSFEDVTEILPDMWIEGGIVSW